MFKLTGTGRPSTAGCWTGRATRRHPAGDDHERTQHVLSEQAGYEWSTAGVLIAMPCQMHSTMSQLLTTGMLVAGMGREPPIWA